MEQIISNLHNELTNGNFKIANAKLQQIIKNYSFLYVSEQFVFDENKLDFNLSQSKVIVIDQSDKINPKTNERYFIIGFNRTIIIIQQSSINILKQLLTNKPNIKICFLSNTKEYFDANFREQYNEIFLNSLNNSEISNFNLQLKIIKSKNAVLNKLWNRIIHCISGYMIKQSYEKLTKNRINDFYSKNDKFLFTNEEEEKDYINLRIIGIGSVFRVDLIYHIDKEELFAIKTPNMNDNETQKLFQRELDNYSKISHPFLPKFYGEIRNKKAIVIEFINGLTLRNVRLNNNDEKITIIFELMIVLNFLHQNRKIYRDLKPNNIMVDLEQKTIVLIDFDRMIFLNNEENTRIFSINYSAPETNQGHFSYESDIYSMGKIIYFIMNERDPDGELLPTDFGEFKEIKELYVKCTNKKPELRPKFPEIILEFFINYHSQIQLNNFIELNEDYFKKMYDKNTIQTMKYIKLDPKDSLALFNIGVFYFKGKYVQKNPNKAFYYYQLAADQNDPVAQFYVGNYYYEGKLIQRDINKAIHYFLLSADKDNEEAQYRLGVIYYEGEYAKKDIKKAMHYLELSAKHNFPPSLYRLGLIYYEGEYIKMDIKKAMHYLKLSAKHNFAPSLYRLGLIYYSNEHIRRNMKKAIRYFKLASEQNYSLAQFKLGVIYFEGDEVDVDLDDAIYYFTLAANQDHTDSQCYLGYIYDYALDKVDINKAFYYYNLAAQKGDPEAQYHLGVIYYEGEFVPLDINKAIHYFTLSAKQDYIKAQKILGFMYYNDQHVPIDINKSIYYLSLAANKKSKKALCALGNFYLEGKFVHKDINKAIHYFSRASDLNYPIAQYILGVIFYEGIDIPKNIKKGIDFLTLAAVQKEPNALFFLGSLFYDGDEGVKKDINKAIQYLSLSANQNDEIAQFFLFLIYIKGVEVKKEPMKAIDFLIQSAQNKCEEASFSLGYLYHEGKYITQNITKAIHFYKEASSFGVQYAKNNLGVIYMNGIDSKVKKNINASIEYFEEAIRNNDDVVSMFNLAHIYIYENSIDHNFDKAIELLVKSSQQKFSISKLLLCIALIKKVGSNINNIKDELAKYINKSSKLFNSVCRLIFEEDLLENDQFLLQYENLHDFNIVYDFLHDITLSKELNKVNTSKKSLKLMKAKNIDSNFYEGFGIHI